MKINPNGLLALEGLEDLTPAPVQTELVVVPVEVPPAVELFDTDVALVENNIIAINEDVTDLNAINDEIHQGVAISDTLDEMVDAIDKADGVPSLAPSDAAVVRLAVEHMQRQLGYNGRRVLPALESFGGVKTRQEGTADLIAHIRGVAQETRQAVSIAREGLEEKVAGIWEQFWSNEQKLGERLKEVSSAFDKGEKHEDAVESPTWGKVLNPEGKDMVVATDLAVVLSKMITFLDNDILADITNRMAEQLQSLCEQVVDAAPDANDPEEVSQMQKTLEELNKLNDRVRTDFPAGDGGKDAQFAPLSQSEKDKVVKLIEHLLDNASLKEAVDKLHSANERFVTVITPTDEHKATTWSGEKGQAIVAEVVQLEGFAIDIMSLTVKLCHAAISYMAESFETK